MEPARRPARIWLLLLAAACLVALAWLPALDSQAERTIGAGLKRALATYAVARTLNGVISVAQETGISVQPAGVGMTFAPGQILDPLNDLVEQFSSIVLAACVSFGIQLILLHIGGSPLVSAALTMAVVAAVAHGWSRHRVAPWAMRLLVVMLFVRFGVPVAAMGSELAWQMSMDSQYADSERQLEKASAGAGEADKSSPAEKSPTIWDILKSDPRKWADAKADDSQQKGRLERMRAWLDASIEHMLRLVALFVVQTILLPLAFLFLLGKLLTTALLRRPS